MLLIDTERCTGCGRCGTVCPEGCIRVENGKARIDHDLCLTCSRCAALCPAQAISWNGTAPEKFRPDLLPTDVQMNELFKERRTMWDFRAEKVPKTVAEEIASMGSHAPTHNFRFRFLLVDDETILDEIETLFFRMNRRMYAALFKNRLVRKLVPALFPAFRKEYLTALPKLEDTMKRGKSFDSMPPLWILVIGDTRTALSLESAQYSLYTMDLYARTKGLGCRNLVGNQMFLNGSPKMRKTLGLGRHEKIFATMGIGYPAMKFANRVEGRSMEISWTEASGNTRG